jgi:carboxysome peptide A
MRILQVERPLVATNRIAGLEHKHLQVVLDGSSRLVAVDAAGSRPGDWVICVGSAAARDAAGSKGFISDLTIVGIIDHWEVTPADDAAPKLTPPMALKALDTDNQVSRRQEDGK